MEPLTDEQQKDVDARVEEFKKRYLANVKELEVDFISYPQYQQTDTGAFVTVPSMQLVDKKYLPIKSPFMDK